MKKVAIVITVIVGVGIGLLLHSRLAAPHPLAPQYASLHLVGFTNSNPKGKFATFCISNDTPARIIYVLTGFDCKTPDGWITAPLDRTSPHWLEFGDGQGGLLRAGDSVSFKVPVRLTNAPWRFHIRCQEHTTGIDGLTDRARDFARNLEETNPMVSGIRIFKGRHYELVSPEISEACPTPTTELGIVELSAHTARIVSLGAGTNCTITPTWLPGGDVQLELAFETPTADGKATRLYQTRFTARSGVHHTVGVGGLLIGIIPKLKAE